MLEEDFSQRSVDAVKCLFLQELSESSRCDLSRTMVYQSINHGNDLTCHAEPVVLFLVLRKNNFSPQHGQRRTKF